MKKLINIVIVGVVGLLIISLHYSCTTYEAPDGIAEDGFDSDSVISTTIHRKVLWINIGRKYSREEDASGWYYCQNAET